MKKKINTIFIGCGRVAQHYKSLLKENPIKDINICGVFDLNFEAAKKFSDGLCENYFDNFQELLKLKDLNLAIICTPSGSHFDQAKILIEKKINLLVEKPLTLKPKQSEILINLAKKNKVLLNVAFQNRLNPAIQLLKKSFEEKRFGKVVTSTIRLRWCRKQEYYNDKWHGRWHIDGGVINQQAIHHIDAFNWIVGPVQKVCSLSANQLNKLEAEDTFVAILKLENGGLGTFEATTAARPEDFEASISIVGEKGIAEIGGVALNEIKQWKFVEEKEFDKNVKKKFSEKVSTGMGLSHLPLLKKVVKTLLNHENNVIISGEDSLNTTKLIHALYKSDEENSWIYLSSNPVSSRLGNNN
jgi:predicted dehydrogenase